MPKQNAIVKAIHARIEQIDREREALDQEQCGLEKLLDHQTVKPKERKKKTAKAEGEVVQ